MTFEIKLAEFQGQLRFSSKADIKNAHFRIRKNEIALVYSYAKWQKGDFKAFGGIRIQEEFRLFTKEAPNALPG